VEKEWEYVLYNVLVEFGAPLKIVRLIKMYLNEAYSKVVAGKHPIQNDLKQGDALVPLLFNFNSEYAIMKVQENQVGLKLIRTHHVLLVLMM
jgi:hypothetical protein